MDRKLDELLDLIDESPRGDAKVALLEEAIRLADLSKDWSNEIYLRRELIEEDCFYGDNMKSIIAFPRYIALIDEHIDEIGSYVIHNMLWAYKYILENGINFHQISLSKLEQILEDFKRRSSDAGYSPRIYYQYKLKYAMIQNNIEEAKYYYQLFKSLARDSISDCHACEINFEVEYNLFINDYEGAIKVAEPLLSGKRQCAEVPHVTYQKLLMYYIKNKELERAKQIVDKAYKYIYKNRSFLAHLEGHLLYAAQTNIKLGIKLFSKHLEWALYSKNDFDNFKFYLASWMLWEQAKLEHKTVISLKLSNQFTLYNPEGNYSVDSLIDYLSKKTIELANKYDKRNGNTNQLDYIEEIKSIIK